MTKRFLFCGASARSLALALPAVARAAEPQVAGTADPSPAAATSTPATADTVGDIVVTAQRRTERLQDVPLSVTAATGDDLARARVNEISRLQFLAPGLTFGQSGFDSRPGYSELPWPSHRNSRVPGALGSSKSWKSLPSRTAPRSAAPPRSCGCRATSAWSR